jgi:P-type Cu2+ transporter
MGGAERTPVGPRVKPEDVNQNFAVQPAELLLAPRAAGSDRAVGAKHPLRRLHRPHRVRARQAAGRRGGARQLLHQTCCGDLARRGEPAADHRDAGRAGYAAHLFDAGADEKDEVLSELVRALGVAGFAAANIMLLSVSVWSGADAATRDFFHIVSALIALPALAYSGRIFFRSALGALAHGRTNMDVPISLGVLTAFAMSLYETLTSGPHAYFDAAVTLLFFLLIGRTLDHMMRERARAAVKNLARLSPRGATVIRPDGTRAYLPVEDIQPGMTLQLAAGDRVPVDARVLSGRLRPRLFAGHRRKRPAARHRGLEPAGRHAQPHRPACASRPLAAARDSFLAEMVRLMEAAEGGRARYRRIADRAAQLYAPVVHVVALATLIGWVAVSGDWHHAILVAISVLIITCPCALGLAVPIVQVVAARRLFEAGILVKDGTGLERLAEIDTVVFDKTGTLSDGAPQLVNRHDIEPAHLGVAAAWPPFEPSGVERHRGHRPADIAFDSVSEHPGFGIEARRDGAGLAPRPARLGRCRNGLSGDRRRAGARRPGAGRVPVRGPAARRRRGGRRRAEARRPRHRDRLRRPRGAVAAMAAKLGVRHLGRARAAGGQDGPAGPAGGAGRKVLMVGDGLNDAPALVAAHASMAPASAADIGRTAADFVFLRPSLTAVTTALDISRRSAALIRQNFAIAIVYNAIAVPIAVLGYVTPLWPRSPCRCRRSSWSGNAMRLRPRAPHPTLAGGDTAAALRRSGMSNLIYLIPVALVLGGIGLAAFLWSLRNGQYDDLDGAAMRILLDDADSDRKP